MEFIVSKELYSENIFKKIMDDLFKGWEAHNFNAEEIRIRCEVEGVPWSQVGYFEAYILSKNEFCTNYFIEVFVKGAVIINTFVIKIEL